MAAAFAKLPVHVLWRLSDKEVPDQEALAELNLADNTKVGTQFHCIWSRSCNAGQTT